VRISGGDSDGRGGIEGWSRAATADPPSVGRTASDGVAPPPPAGWAPTGPVAVTTTPAAGTEPSFDELYASEWAPMVRLAHLLVGSGVVAEELVQDAFARVYERWGRVDNHGGYLRTCVVNGVRRSQRRTAFELRVVHERGEAVEMEARELLDALGRLKPRWRAVVVLRFYGGLTQDEIAEALGMRAGTVKSALHRALQQLREELEP
jgi:RNA polymerase sigma-70 factor (sigma-E family)